MYLGATFALLIIEVIARAASQVQEFRLYTEITIHPALIQAVEYMGRERRLGRSLEEAAAETAARWGRPQFRIVVVDNLEREVFESPPPASFGSLSPIIIALAAAPSVSAPVRGGHIAITSNPSLLYYWITSDFRRMLPSLLIAILIAYLFARLIAVQATRPVRALKEALHAFSEGSFSPRPVATTGLSDFDALSLEYNAAAVRVQKAVHERNLAAENIRHFISDAGHELKTPLTIIMGYLDAVSEGLVTGPERVEHVTKRALGECRRMRATIEKLILLAHLDRDDANVATVEVAGLVNELADAMRADAPGLQVEIAHEAREAKVVAEVSELREAIVNVIENAVKYAPGSPIDVHVSATAHAVVIEVVDAGPGMPPDDRERAFERFYRGSTHGDVGGSGLGLAIAKRAAQRANGRMTLTSELGRGTSVKFYFPLSEAGYPRGEHSGGRQQHEAERQP